MAMEIAIAIVIVMVMVMRIDQNFTSWIMCVQRAGSSPHAYLAHTHTYAHAHAHTHTLTRTQIHIHTYAGSSTHAYLAHTHTYAHAHTHTHTHTYTRTYTHAHTHTPLQVVQHEPVQYPSDVPISTSLRHALDCMLIKVKYRSCFHEGRPHDSHAHPTLQHIHACTLTLLAQPYPHISPTSPAQHSSLNYSHSPSSYKPHLTNTALELSWRA